MPPRSATKTCPIFAKGVCARVAAAYVAAQIKTNEWLKENLPAIPWLRRPQIPGAPAQFMLRNCYHISTVATDPKIRTKFGFELKLRARRPQITARNLALDR